MISKLKRRSKSLEEAQLRFQELPEGTKCFNEFHWGIPTVHGAHINYWPTRSKWSDPSGQHPRSIASFDGYMIGDFDELLGFIKQINDIPLQTEPPKRMK